MRRSVACSSSGDYAITSNTCVATVAAGATCTVGVTFKPTLTGSRNGTLSFADNAANSPQSVALSGTGIMPIVSLSPAALTFVAPQAVGSTSSVQNVTVTNSLAGSLLIVSSVTITGDFAVASNGCATVTGPGSCTIGVTFRPSASGTRTGMLFISDNSANSPQQVPLSGTGATAPSLSLNPTLLAFGDQAVNVTSGARTVAVTNSGNASLTVSGVTIAGQFLVASNGCTKALAPGASCAIGVTFRPASLGDKSGTLTITTTAAGSPHQVPLSGTGVAPAVTITSATATLKVAGGKSTANWNIPGTSTAIGATVTVRLTRTNAIVGTAKVSASGAWSVSVNSSAVVPAAGDSVSATTPGATAVTALVTIR